MFMNLPDNEVYIFCHLKCSLNEKAENNKTVTIVFFFFIETYSAKHTGHIVNCFQIIHKKPNQGDNII